MHKTKTSSSSISTNDKKENLKPYHHKAVFLYMPHFEYLCYWIREKYDVIVNTTHSRGFNKRLNSAICQIQWLSQHLCLQNS